MTSDGSYTYTYDAEGNIVKVDSGSTAAYLYDALNHRVRTVVGGVATEFVFNQNGQRVSVWNATTKTVERDQYYWGGKPVAFTASGATHFQHQDWLGTERARTAYNGTVEGTYISLPFGDGYTPPESDLDPYHYAQLDYDSESNTSHAQFRQYSASEATWMSPDPYSGSYDLSNPQTLNRYAYARNNPTAWADPSGLCPSPGRTGQVRPCTVGGGSNDGEIDGIDEFAFMEIPVYGYGVGYIPTQYLPWAPIPGGGGEVSALLIGGEFGYYYQMLGDGFDYAIPNWMPTAGYGTSDSAGGYPTSNLQQQLNNQQQQINQLQQQVNQLQQQLQKPSYCHNLGLTIAGILAVGAGAEGFSLYTGEVTPPAIAGHVTAGAALLADGALGVWYAVECQ